MDKFDVTVERYKYLGGSDIPIILGISPFKTRWELLQEKAELKENTFAGTKYTAYGDTLEPKIRDYINAQYNTNFAPDQIIVDDLRGNCDGFNGECILEVKTTSHIYETVEEYKLYLVQLLFYMQLYKVEKGILAVYSRPSDLDTKFSEELLQIYEININEYKTLLENINAEIGKFRADLEQLKNNPLLTEQDFQPTELITISKRVVEIENRIAELKVLETEQKKVKQQLFEAMAKFNVKSWETPNGTKITRVDAVEPTIETVSEFDEERFKEEQKGLYFAYLHDVTKKKSGKAGYVKITLPKGDK